MSPSVFVYTEHDDCRGVDVDVDVHTVVVLAAPKEDRRRFMLHAHDAGMTNGDYVFYTIDILPDEEVMDPESVWKGNDGRDVEAKEAFEAVFHVSTVDSLH